MGRILLFGRLCGKSSRRFASETAKDSPSPGGENSPNPNSRFEPLNRYGIGAPSTGSATCQPYLQRAERVLGAPVHGEGRGEGGRLTN